MPKMVSSVHFLLQSFMKGDYMRYWEKSDQVAAVQQEYLLSLVRRNTHTQFGKKHGFGDIQSISDFRQAVPVSGYEYYEPYIESIAQGSPDVLTADPVLRLVPTSATSGFNKYIPYTRTTTSEFNRALNVWIYSLYKEFPRLKKGRSFWLISPGGQLPDKKSVVQVGFENDDAYFGKVGKWLINRTMVLPPQLKHVAHAANHMYLMCLYLLAAPDVRLISVWNPGFLTIMLQYMVQHKKVLLQALYSGRIVLPEKGDKAELFSFSANKKLALRLEKLLAENDIHHTRWNLVWPDLELISCWNDAWASHHMPLIRKLFGDVAIQGKGLLATEAAVTIPLMEHHLPAYGSHFFEFEEGITGNMYLLHELQQDHFYDVVVTTGSGLYRYRLNDQVKVKGFCDGLPSLQFTGKSNIVSDLVGEKLSEHHVEVVLGSIREKFNLSAKVLFLSPCVEENRFFYTLYTDEPLTDESVARFLDHSLKQVFYYGQARDYGQLEMPRVYCLSGEGMTHYFENINKTHQQGTSKFLSLNRAINLYQQLDGKFII
jgi:hypothetical protein